MPRPARYSSLNCPADGSGAPGRPRCGRCARPRSHCLCEFIPSLDNGTPVVILQHPQESRHALNTGRLAALGLRHARLVCSSAFAASDWEYPGRAPVLLFPGPKAVSLAAPASGAVPQRCVLVVPDATWRHARGMIHRHPDLAALPRVTLPEGPPGRYRVRKAPGRAELSTIEAIARALDLLDAPARHDALLRPFEALVQGQIQAMGPAIYRRHHANPHGD